MAARGGADRGAHPVQRPQPERKAASLLPQEIGRGNAASLERDLAEGMGRGEDLGARKAESRRAGGHEEGGDPFSARLGIGRGEHDVEVGDSRVRDVRLGAVQDVVASFPPRPRAERGDVRAGFGLGHGERGHRASRDRLLGQSRPRRRAGQEKGQRPETLQREHRVGERTLRCERLARETAGAPVAAADRIEQLGRPDRGEKRPRFDAGRGIALGRRAGRDLARGERGGLGRECLMGGIEEGSNRARLGDRHQRNRGSRFSRKAS
jgi:hypothetical protein